MTRELHRRDHGIPPGPLLVADREENAFHHALPEDGHGGDPGGGAPRTAFPRGVPQRSRPDLEKGLPEDGRLPDGDIRVGEGDLPAGGRAPAQEEPVVEDGPRGDGPGDVGDMGRAGQSEKAVERLPDPVLPLLVPPEQAGFLGHLPARGESPPTLVLPGKKLPPAPGDRLRNAVRPPASGAVPSPDGEAGPSRYQGHRGSVGDLFHDRSRHGGQPRAGAHDRGNGERRGELEGEAEIQSRRDDAGPGDLRDERVHHHGRGGSPGEEGEKVGDPVVPFPRKEVRDEENRGGGRSDRRGKEVRDPSGDPLPEEEEEKEVRRGGRPGGEPEPLQRAAAG